MRLFVTGVFSSHPVISLAFNSISCVAQRERGKGRLCTGGTRCLCCGDRRSYCSGSVSSMRRYMQAHVCAGWRVGTGMCAEKTFKKLLLLRFYSKCLNTEEPSVCVCCPLDHYVIMMLSHRCEGLLSRDGMAAVSAQQMGIAATHYSRHTST